MKLSRGYFCKHRPVVALNSLIISSFPLCSVKREFGLGERRGAGGGGGGVNGILITGAIITSSYFL